MLNRSFVAAGLMAAMTVIAGCDRVQLLAPTNSTVTVSASTRVLAAGAATEVTAMVLESAGTPVQNGTTVRFTTTLGRVEPVEVQTRNGFASTTFYAGDASGVAEIRATSGGAGAGSSSNTGTGGTGSTPGSSTTTTTASNVVQISVGAAAVETVSVQANPSFVSFNGGTVDVVATVLGAGGRLLSGVPVTFLTTAGSLNPPSAVTDGNGQARTRLTTNLETTVTATAGGKSVGENGGAKVTVLPAPAVTLTCEVGTATNCRSVLSGQPVSFTAARVTGTSSIRSASLDFGDGSSLDLGTLAGSTVIPHVYTQPGDYTARLSVTDINGETVTVSSVVHVVEPASASLSATVVSSTSRTVRATASATGGVVASYKWTFDTTTFTTTINEATFSYGGTPPLLAVTKTIFVEVTFTDGRTASAATSISLPAVP